MILESGIPFLAKGDVPLTITMGASVAQEIKSKHKAELPPTMPTSKRDPNPPTKPPKPVTPKRKRRGTSTRVGQAKKRAATTPAAIIDNFFLTRLHILFVL